MGSVTTRGGDRRTRRGGMSARDGIAHTALGLRLALETLQERAYRRPATFAAYRLSDGALDQLCARLRDYEAEANMPLQVQLGKYDGENWLVASFGHVSRDAQCVGGAVEDDVHVTTDQVHCSEVRGDALSDAECYVGLRNALPGILASLEELLAVRREIAERNAALAAARAPGRPGASE